ncbi:hypothetical protein JCM19231_1915 [Vibrio ishigakensis]|uniref:Uncharacterized protein n=2 Tax=Vibrio ishigakensis TaxID=1481914 RepID=A0A0B8NWI2_9VIBR|nr:hypothetical protein JCM19231_1915 [Vibrio ishigakensis]
MARIARLYGYPVKFGRYNDERMAQMLGQNQRHIFNVSY